MAETTELFMSAQVFAVQGNFPNAISGQSETKLNSWLGRSLLQQMAIINTRCQSDRERTRAQMWSDRECQSARQKDKRKFGQKFSQPQNTHMTIIIIVLIMLPCMFYLAKFAI